MKIVINKDFGGFSVSKAVFDELNFQWDSYGYINNDSFGIKSDNSFEYRKHPRLIAAIEKIGKEKANGKYANIDIVDIPNDVEWYINDYDGFETIHEVHREW